MLRASINSLINDFPYTTYIDNEVVEIYNNYDFSLGTSNKIRLKIVQHFRSLTQYNLSTTLHKILDKINSNQIENLDIDLNTENLPLRSLLSK
jgi:hypothetical protein